jgi:hypothetical protein
MNSAFQALASNSSGATEPGTTYAYQWWYDETTDILKMRNADDDAWINIASFDQANDTWAPYVGATALTANGAELNLLDGALNHATAAWEAGTATESGVPSPADVKAAIDALGGGADFSAIAEAIIPDADSTRNLGASDKAWLAVYADAIEPVGTDTTIKRVGGTNTTPIVEGIAKAWVNLNGTGTAAITNSFNVPSITDLAAGRFTINVTSAFDDATYAITTQATKDTSDTAQRTYGFCNGDTITASAIDIRVQAVSDNSFQDESYIYVVFHGDLA